jgi:hypothetical protein
LIAVLEHGGNLRGSVTTRALALGLTRFQIDRFAVTKPTVFDQSTNALLESRQLIEERFLGIALALQMRGITTEDRSVDLVEKDDAVAIGPRQELVEHGPVALFRRLFDTTSDSGSANEVLIYTSAFRERQLL